MLKFYNWITASDVTKVNYDTQNPGIEYSSGTLTIKHNHPSLPQLIQQLNHEDELESSKNTNDVTKDLYILERQAEICLTTHNKILTAYNDDKTQRGLQIRGNLPGAIKEDEFILDEIKKGKYGIKR